MIDGFVMFLWALLGVAALAVASALALAAS
jgi:hypothetical protein